MQGKDINKLKQIIEELACGHSPKKNIRTINYIVIRNLIIAESVI